MLPIITLIFINCLLDATSSPVYNMQPAYITANIVMLPGTTGRNIRNLPCISRRNNQRGVCMFAIDCLKANGTHLGTCIDRFYFGSCCHVEQSHEILDNSIDASIFPEREPPSRINSTEKPTTSKLSELLSTLNVKPTPPAMVIVKSTTSTAKIIPNTTTEAAIISTKVTTQTMRTKPTTKVPVILTKEPVEVTEMSYKLTTFQSVDGIANDMTTLRPIIPIKSTITFESKTTSKPTTDVIQKKPVVNSTTNPILVSLVTKPTVSKPIPTTTTVTVATPKPIVTKPTTIVSKPLTAKPTQNPATKKPTNKPVRTTVKSSTTIKPSVRPTQKPIRPKPSSTTKPSSKPTISTKHPTKPTRSTTKKPPTTSRSTTTKLTKRPTTSYKVTTTTSRPTIKTTSISTTPKPEITTKTTMAAAIVDTTTKSSTEGSSTPINFLIKGPTTEKTELESPASADVPIEVILPSTAKPQTEKVTDKSSSTESNDVYNIPLNISANPAEVSGNIVTNEIEAVKPTIESTTKPSLITWITPSEEPTIGSLNTTDEDWVPITTPDGWVLLPSVSSTMAAVSDTISSSTASPLTTEPEMGYIQANHTSSEKEPIMIGTTTPETSTKESNYTEYVNEFLETTSMQIDVNISEAENLVNMTDFTDVCGRRMYPKARIVGGENSSFGKWPWQISLRQWRTSTYLHKCGAALLNENWAITAAHCVDSVPPSDLLLRLGEHDLSTEGEPYLHQERRVQIVASHPQFDPRTFEYDLALLRFYEPVKFQPNILPVCVPQSDDDFIGSTAYVTGWGRLYEDGPLPSILQEVSVPVINNTLCESMYRSAGYIEHIPHIFICAGWRRGGFDSCEGDSGGPMVIQRSDKRFLLAGVISWGIGCAEPNQPGVYTRISEFRDWINQILQF